MAYSPKRLPLSGRQSNGNSSTPAFRNSKDVAYPSSPSPSGSIVLARDASLNALTGVSTAMDDLEVGDVVDVPGGMTGTVKYIGPVHGKNGVFAGVELSHDYSARGKNDGHVDGTRYFTTSVAGAGIFLPAHRAVRNTSPTSSSFPPPPTTPATSNFNPDRSFSRNNDHTPPTPSVSRLNRSIGPGARPNFTQSVGPGARAPSPQVRQSKARPSLPRPESPMRKQPLLQPASSAFAKSVHGSRPIPAMSPAPRASLGSRTPQNPMRSPSRGQSRNGVRDMDSTPIVSRLTNGARVPPSTSRPSSKDSDNSEETQRLRRDLEERDRQLKDQASSLAEMESSLAELQTMFMETSAPKPAHPNERTSQGSRDGETSSAELSQLRGLLREKNEKVTSLMAEFDAHRADFRNTIDTLEMASTETERVYEKRVEELLQELEQLNGRGDDVESVARQLKQLEELVAELEEGLEDARRGEAEARGEVEFLRGEVERGRSEIRRERDKATKALKLSEVPAPTSNREVEQRDDEIRGLKAIIHSLSSGPDLGSPMQSNRNSANNRQSDADAAELASLQESIAGLTRDKAELQTLVEKKTAQTDELSRELAIARAPRPNESPLASLGQPAIEHRNSVAASNTSTNTAFFRPNTASSAGHADIGSFPAPPSTAHLAARPTTASSAGGALHSPTALTFHDASETRNAAEEAKMAAPPIIGADGPAPGKASKVIDLSKWCALCERDGHESVDCPFEDEF